MAHDLRPEIWRAIRRAGAQGARFDALTIRGLLRGAVKRERVQAYLRALAAGGYLVAVEMPDDAPGYQILRDPGVEAPRVRPDGTPVTMGQGREALWRTLRILGVCTLRELVATASTAEWTIAEAEARDYCDRLTRVGILTRERGPGGTCYRLPPTRYSGPRPPRIRRTKEVYDPNTGTLYAADGTVLARGRQPGGRA